MAAQVSLPSMSVPRTWRGTDLLPCVGRLEGWRVGHNQPIEQSGGDVAERDRRHGRTGSRQLAVTLGVELAPARARRLDPVLKALLIGRHQVETHVGEPIAAELR